ILPQRPRELAVADVDRVHASRPAPEEAVGEAPGRGANIERHRVSRVEVEGNEGSGELLAAAADIRGWLGPQPDRRIARYRCPRLRHRAIANQDRPRHDEPLRALPVGGEAAVDEGPVNSDPGARALLARLRRAPLLRCPRTPSPDAHACGSLVMARALRALGSCGARLSRARQTGNSRLRGRRRRWRW